MWQNEGANSHVWLHGLCVPLSTALCVASPHGGLSPHTLEYNQWQEYLQLSSKYLLGRGEQWVMKNQYGWSVGKYSFLWLSPATVVSCALCLSPALVCCVYYIFRPWRPVVKNDNRFVFSRSSPDAGQKHLWIHVIFVLVFLEDGWWGKKCSRNILI